MGGQAREWTRRLERDLTPGAAIQFDLVLTKWQAPAIDVGVELRLEARSGVAPATTRDASRRSAAGGEC